MELPEAVSVLVGLWRDVEVEVRDTVRVGEGVAEALASEVLRLGTAPLGQMPSGASWI